MRSLDLINAVLDLPVSHCFCGKIFVYVWKTMKIKLVTKHMKLTYQIFCIKEKGYTIAPLLLLFAQMALKTITDDSTCFILILLAVLPEMNHPCKKETLNDISSTIVLYFIKVNYIERLTF